MRRFSTEDGKKNPKYFSLEKMLKEEKRKSLHEWKIIRKLRCVEKGGVRFSLQFFLSASNEI
jgi:hypothetical protein